MSSNRKIWLNGNMVPPEEATVSVLSPTCQFGANVFEGIRCYWDGSNLLAFRLEDHHQRLLRSLKMMRLESPYSIADLETAFREAVLANSFKEDIAVRQTIFLDGFGSWFSQGPVSMFVAPIAKGRFLEKEQAGLDCCISSWERIKDNSLSPRIKVGANYINSRMGQIEAMQNGFDSALFLNAQGNLSEAPGSCLFLVREGRLITPPLTASILESITRASIIEIARDRLGLEVIERDVNRTELYIAEEAFLCGTAVEIAPIKSVDRISLDSFEITNALRKEFFDIVQGTNDHYRKWLTII